MPVHSFRPYIGDYNFRLAVDGEFRDIFLASSTPHIVSFPQRVKYQREADVTIQTVQDGSGGTFGIRPVPSTSRWLQKIDPDEIHDEDLR